MLLSFYNTFFSILIFFQQLSCFVCSFGVRDVCGHVRRKANIRRHTFYLVIFLTICPKLVLVKWNERFLIRQKLILKFHEKKKKNPSLNTKNIFQKM